MKHGFKRTSTALLVSVLGLSLLTGCTSPKTPDEAVGSEAVQQQSDAAVSSEAIQQQSDAAVSLEADWPQSGSAVTSVDDFTTQDLNGNTVTQDIFKEYELTMVNIFTTWCTPCVEEMPDLEMLYQEMKDKNVGVVGVVLDVLNEKGEIVDKDLERAQLLVQKTGVTYPVILPDPTYMNGRLISIEAFPETFFVDKNGNIVGETYSGSGSFEDWLETVEKELSNLEVGA